MGYRPADRLLDDLWRAKEAAEEANWIPDYDNQGRPNESEGYEWE